ncbi:hypothetical protein ScPMuIL_011368 [Solemya velum]
MATSCYQTVNGKFGDVSAWYGRKISRHPWKVILVCVLFNGLLGIGLVRLEINDDALTLFTPENNRAQQDRDKINSLFSSNSSSNFYVHNTVDLGYTAHVIIVPQSGEVLDSSFMDEAENIYRYITDISVMYKGQKLAYTDICAKRDSKCVVSGNEFFELPTKNLFLLKQIPYPQYGNIYLPPIFGKAKAENDILVSAGAYRMQFNLRDDDAYIGVVEQWMGQFIERMKNLDTNMTSVVYKHYFSISDEMNANLFGDITLFAVTFLLMCAYASLATINGNCLADRAFLGMAGVFATVLAILGAFGLCSACGVPFVSIVGVVPFLVVGIGVDDMFILLSGMADAIEHDTEIEDRVARMMRTSGMGITITSLTDLLGFLIGSLSIFPAIRYFCIYTGVSILFCYINHVTFFTSCVTIDQKRVQVLRHSKTCMRIQPMDKLEAEGAGWGHIYCCSGKLPQRREDVESPLESYPRKFFTFLSSYKPMKWFTVILILVYWGISIWGAIFFKEGLLIENLVNSESYFYKYSVSDRNNYNSEAMLMLVIEEELDYTSADVRKSVQDLLTNVKSNQYIENNFQLSWLQAYMASPVFNTTTKESFAQNLKLFLNDPSGELFREDVVFSDDIPTAISFCRLYLRSLPSDDSQIQSTMMEETRGIVDRNALKALIYSPTFLLSEQYATILEQTVQTLGIVAACIFVVTFIFMPHPFIVVLVTVAVASMMTGLIGFMYFWDLTLSSITMIHIIMSIGFSVDYSAHICHAFMISHGKTRDEKMRSAMKHAGGPVFSGAFSSFLGIIVLIFTSSYIFQSFFKVMLTVIITGVLHALLFLPTILSVIGPLASVGSNAKVSPSPTLSDILSLGDFRIQTK